MKKKRLIWDRQATRRGFLKKGTLVLTGAALSPLIKISPVGAASEIKIGFVTGLTGFGAAWGRTALQAYSLIADEINAAGGIKSLGGAKIKLMAADSKTDLKIQASETEKMINVNKVKLFFQAAGSGLGMVGSSVCEKYGAVNVDLSTGDPLTERGLKYYFRIACRASDNGKVSIAFASNMQKNMGKKFKKVGVIHSDDGWGASAGKSMEAEILKHPEWDFAGRVAYPAAKLVDATDYVNRAKGQGIEVLFQASTPESGIMVQLAVKSLNYNLQANIHAHGAPCKKEYVDALGKDADYVCCAVHFVADMLKRYPKNAVDYAARYKARYQGEDMDDSATVASVAAATLINAIERARSDDPDKVREALVKTDLMIGDSPYIMVRDGVKFDETNHNVRAQTSMHQMVGGILRCLWPDKYKTREPIWPVPQWKDRG